MDQQDLLKEIERLRRRVAELEAIQLQPASLDKALRESEERYRTLVEHLPQKVFVKDLDSVYVLCNEPYAKDLGIATADIAGKTDFDFFPRELAEKYRADDRKVMKIARVEEIEEKYLDRGEPRTALTVKKPLQDEHGNVYGVLGTFIDVTERKRLEEAAGIEKRRFEVLAENSPFGLVMIDEDGVFQYVNPKFCEMFGYELKDISTGREWFKKAYPENAYRRQVIAAWQEDLANFGPGEQRPRVFNVTCKDGQEKTVHFRPVQLHTGEHLMTCEDITERQRDRETLQESQERYKQLTESSLTGIYIHQDGRFVFVNDRLSEIMGYPKEEIVGKEFWSFVHPEDRGEIRERGLRISKGETLAPKTQFRVVTGSGDIKWLEVLSAPINFEGRSANMGNVADVTERKQVELERLLEVRFLQDIDRIERSLGDSEDVEDSLGKVLKEALSVLECDRAWLMYPCDPDAISCRVAVERNNPEFPGAFSEGRDLPVTEELAASFSATLKSNRPLVFHPEQGLPMPDSAREYSIRSSINCAIVPSIGKPWLLGMSQCSHPRIWTEYDQRLFTEVGHRISEALNTLLLLRNLSSSERRYRSLFENSRDAIIVVSREGLILDVNCAFSDLFGYSNDEELRGTSALQLWANPEDRARWRNELEATGGLQDYELKARRKDGEIRDCLLTSSTGIGDDGSVCYQTICRDITEQKRAQEALLESEQMFRLLSEQSLMSVAVLQDGVYKYTNHAMADLCEYSIDEILGWKPEEFLELVHPEDRNLVMKQARMKQSGDPLQKTLYSFRIMTKSGAAKWVEIYSKTVQFKGRPANLLTMVDMTERGKAEEALRESEEKYRLLAENVSDVIWTSDLGLRMTYVSPSVERLFGWSADKWPSLEPSDYLPPASMERALTALQKELATQEAEGAEPNRVTTLEMEQYRKDGSTFWTEVSARLLLDDRQSPVGIIGVTRDITERKKAEEAVRESEEHYKNFFDNALVGLFRARLSDGLFLEINSKAAEQQGLPAEEIVGKVRSSDLYRNPKQRDELLEILKEQGEAHDFEADLTLPDGRDATFSLSVKAYPDRDYLEGAVIDITDRKNVEKTLRENEAFLAGIWRTSPVGIAIGRERIFTWANPAWAKMHGYKDPEEIIGQSTSVAYASNEEFERTGKIFYEALKTQEVAETEALCRRKDGSLFHARMWLTRVNPNNPDEGVIGAVIDVTERKIAEEDRRLYAQRLEALLKLGQMIDAPLTELAAFAMEEAVRLTRSSIGYVAFASEDESVLTMHAWSQEAMRQCAIEKKPLVYPVAHTGLWGEAVRQRRPIVTNDYAATNPCKKGTPNGHVEVMRHMNVPIFDQGRIVVVAGVGNKLSGYDDNDTRQLTLLMEGMWGIVRRRESEQRLKMLGAALEHAGESILITDPSGTILYANPAFTETTGYSMGEALGKTPALLRSGKQAEGFYEDMWSTIERGEIWRGHLTNKRKDGSLYEESATISPIKDETGNTVNFVMVGRDVTSEILLQKQLFHSQKMEAIGTLAGGIAHDVNNLLQAVLGYSDLLLMKKGPGDPDAAKLKVIQQAARDGAELVSRILTFSRKGESKTLPLDINEQILKAEKLLRRTIPRMIEIDLALTADIGIVDADPAQLEQVILNLGVNAQHAMPEGGRLLLETSNVSLSDEYLRAHLGAKPGRYVLLTVSDTGRGMDPTVLERIFEPFFTTKPSGQGTGLGLSMVHGIVTQHGGYIRCYSEPGEGTAFKIYFPISKSGLAIDPSLTREMPAFGNETILLVDDDDRIREMGRQMIEIGGYKVITAKSGEEALDVHSTHKDEIALIILDLIMPGMGGSRCLEELLRKDPNVKVLVASGYTSNGLSQADKGRGARGFVSKPYDAKDILWAIRKALDEGK